MLNLPDIGFVRLPQIIGNPKADPPIPAIIPVSSSSWWAGVASGRFPRPVKIGPKTTAWINKDIKKLAQEIEAA